MYKDVWTLQREKPIPAAHYKIIGATDSCDLSSRTDIASSTITRNDATKNTQRVLKKTWLKRQRHALAKSWCKWYGRYESSAELLLAFKIQICGGSLARIDHARKI